MKRSGRTAKISISLDREDLALVQRRAKRVHAGNISKAIADAVRYLRYEEGRDALLEAFGDEGQLGPGELDAIVSEWRSPTKTSSKKRRRSAA